MRFLVRGAGRVAWELLLPAILITAWWLWSVEARSLFYPPLLRTFTDTWFGPGFAEHVLPSLRNLALGCLIGAVWG